MATSRKMRALAIGGCILFTVYACTIASSESPATPYPQPPSVTGTLATDRIWGVADLHAHPASHLAFGGLNGQVGLIWGDPALPGGRMTYVPGGDLPDIPACDPSTHEANVSDEISRFTRGLVFQNLTKVTNLPHTPHGGPTNSGGASQYESWPNGRDILHQAMNIQSIRRAYEGGLRLMLASTVEAQTIGFAMHTTIFPNPFAPTRQAERASAEAQLQYIQSLVNANADWMEIASTPEQAESAIRQGRLAIILALENDGLLLEDIRDLVQTYGVGAIVPVHLVDNDVGGTAAYEDLFNSATALEGQMFGYPNRFISVEPDSTLDFHLSWPQTLQSVGVAFNIGSVSYATAAALGYSQYPLCAPPGLGIPAGTGERNSVGLREPQTLGALMAMGLLVDVAHMGFHSVDDTIGVAQSTCNYPIVDTHTLFHGQGGNERNLYMQHAAYVASSQGVVGFGSSGTRTSEGTCGANAGGFNTIVSARGGPVLFLGGGGVESAVIQFPATSRACTPSLPAEDGAIGLRVATSDSLSPGSTAYAQVTFDGGAQVNQPLALNETTSIVLGRPASQVSAISVNLLDPSSCSYAGGAVNVDSVTITDATGAGLATIGPGVLGSTSGSSSQTVVTLSSQRSSFTVYQRCPSGSPTVSDPAEAFLAPITAMSQPRQHLQIQMISGTDGLQSASALILGARVTGSLCLKSDCSDVEDPCSAPQFTMTSAGGWSAGSELDQYLPIRRGDTPLSYRAIKICLTEPDLTGEPWELDQININLAVDPTRLWTGDYARFLQNIFHGRVGAMGLGTDINGLAAQFPFADFSPAYADQSYACGQTADPPGPGPARYGDEMSGGTFTLHRPLRIGTTALCFPDRGLATYGMLPEFFAAVYNYNKDVYRSLFSSAGATIDAWKAARAAASRFATAPASCPVGGSEAPDAGSSGSGSLDGAGTEDGDTTGADASSGSACGDL